MTWAARLARADVAARGQVMSGLYESAKRDLATKDWKYVQNYADAKSAVVGEINARARGG